MQYCQTSHYNWKPRAGHPEKLPRLQIWAEEVNKEIQELKKNGIIEESESPWASSIVAVRKKTGKLRICVDYRRLNEIAVKDSYPMPRIDEILDELSKGRIFSTLDAASGYNQLEIDERDRHKTAFRWRGGFF